MPFYITEIFNTAPKLYNMGNADINIPRFRTVLWKTFSTTLFDFM